MYTERDVRERRKTASIDLSIFAMIAAREWTSLKIG